jgi:hypothetical protein
LRCWHCAPVAQLDRAFASGAKGRWFESTRAYHNTIKINNLTEPAGPVMILLLGQKVGGSNPLGVPIFQYVTVTR